MASHVQRKTVYVATLVAIFAMVGAYAFAQGTTYQSGPAQNSTTTVTAPAGFSTASVQSLEDGVVTALIADSASAGTQETGTNGLGGTVYLNSALSCSGASCNYDFAAIPTSPGTALTPGDQFEQVVLTVQDTAPQVGFDVQIEVALSTGTLIFGNGYFETALEVTTGSTVTAFLFLDLGFNPITTATTVSDVAIVFNSCQSATVCP